MPLSTPWPLLADSVALVGGTCSSRHSSGRTFAILLLSSRVSCSINVFTFGCTLYFWQLNKMLMAFYPPVAGSRLTAYLLMFTLPSVANLPLFHYSTFIFY